MSSENDFLAMDFNQTVPPTYSETEGISEIEETVPVELGWLWVSVIPGLVVYSDLKTVHGPVVSVIVALVAAIAAFALIAGIIMLIIVVYRPEKVRFCRNGVMLMKGRGLRSHYDWTLIPWTDIVKVDLRTRVALLYGGSTFRKTHLTFIRKIKKESLASAADALLVRQHRGEIPASVQIVGP